MDHKTPHKKDANSPPNYLTMKFQSKIPERSLYRYTQVDSKIYMEREIP